MGPAYKRAKNNDAFISGRYKKHSLGAITTSFTNLDDTG
jgi:hypothetical protein